MRGYFTHVPWFLPETISAMWPGFFILKTAIGTWCSRHIAKAATSMMASCFWMTSSKERFWNLTASSNLFGSLSYMPSTLVALRIASASISIARRAAAVSVVQNGLPVPAVKMTTLPFSRWRIARPRMNVSATDERLIAESTRAG